MGRESLVPWIGSLLSYVISNKVISLLWENNVSLGWLQILFLALWCLWKHWQTLGCYTRVQDYHHCYHPCVRSHLKQDQVEAWQQGWVTCATCCSLEVLAEEAKRSPWGEHRKRRRNQVEAEPPLSSFQLSLIFFFFQACSFELSFCVSFHLPFQV